MTTPEQIGVDDRQITSNPVDDSEQGFGDHQPTGDYGELLARAEAAVRLLANTQMALSLSDWSHMANDLLAPLTAIRTLLVKVEQLERGKP